MKNKKNMVKLKQYVITKIKQEIKIQSFFVKRKELGREQEIER